ncbi:basigin isoform X2 [Maniola jurtina]|uniref:basigin isoform X2 n=1 Tax=Maniola jurtina TaxID=191418 RepID=UPI001E68DE88|nr:basigin isoform X2 [Maniola jurtina]
MNCAAAAPAADAPPEVLYDVRSNFTLLCPLVNDKSLDYVWRKNETEISLVWEMKDRYVLERGGAEFRVARAFEDDFGNYSCALPGVGEARWAVRGRPHLKLPANTNVVEGQKLKLTCKVVGKPYARVQWSYSNSTDGPYVPLDDSAALADSEAGVPDGVLLLAAAARRHAGHYRCDAPAALLPATTTLRVKDMYAALWPFLGICAEVFVLCAIILLYERRRTKPDLDDSDTDNHDQKKS